MEKGLRVAMELETPGYTRPLGGLGSSVCIPRHRSVSPTNRQLESSSSSSALRDGPPLRLQPRPLGVIKDDNFINCMSAGAARGAPPLVAYHRSAAPARPGVLFRAAASQGLDGSAPRDGLPDPHLTDWARPYPGAAGVRGAPSHGRP